MDGYLTFSSAAAAGGGGYASVTLPEPASSIGASMSFSPFTEPGGLVALVLWSEDIGASLDAGEGVPAAPVHFTISPEQWAYGVMPANGSEYKVIDSGQFSTQLVADGKAVYSVNIEFDGTEGIADITLPTGQKVHIEDEAMKQEVFIACVEPYRETGTTGSTVPLISAWWAN